MIKNKENITIDEFKQYLTGKVKIQDIDELLTEKIKSSFVEFEMYWDVFKSSNKYKNEIYLGKTIDRLIKYHQYEWINNNLNIITLKKSFFLISLINIEKDFDIINDYVKIYKNNNYRQDIIKSIEGSVIYMLNITNDEDYIIKKIIYLNNLYQIESPQNKDKYLIKILKDIQNSRFKNNYKIIDNLISTIINNNGIGFLQLNKITQKYPFIRSVFEEIVLQNTVLKKDEKKIKKNKI